MAGNITFDGIDGGTGDVGAQFHGEDFAGRIAQIGSRTSLMAIDGVLRVAPADPLAPFPPAGAADTIAEVKALARRMLQATRDFQATVQQPAEQGA